MRSRPDRAPNPLPRRASPGSSTPPTSRSSGPPRPQRHAPLRSRRVPQGPTPLRAHALSFAGELRARGRPRRLISRVSSAPASCASPRVRHRIGFAAARRPAMPTPSASTSPTPSASTPWTATGVAEALGAGDVPKRLSTSPSIQRKSAARDEMAKLPRPWIAVAVGREKWTTKRWPRALRRTPQPRWVRAGGTCFFVGAAEDTPAAREVIAQLNGPPATSPARPRSPPRRRTLAL